MTGAEEYVKAGQPFLFKVPASLSAYLAATFTYDETIRQNIQGVLQGIASNVLVKFDSPVYPSRTSWTLLSIAGVSRIDRNQGRDILGDCVNAAAQAGLVLEPSQADIDIYPPGSSVSYSYAGLANAQLPAGLPAAALLLIGGLFFVVIFSRR